MLLYNAVKKREYLIRKVRVQDKKVLLRLYDLGVKVGAKIYVERSSLLNACFIIVVNGKRVAISKQIAMEIDV